jgi:23S rRNA (guanosine2251-2'-O)-methyltransferase
MRRGLEGKGTTPKAEDRPYHVAYRANGSRRGQEWVAGRNAVLEAMEAEIPIKAAYVAEAPNATTASVTFSSSLRAEERRCSRSRGVSRTGALGCHTPRRRVAAIRARPPRRPAGCGPGFRSDAAQVALDSITDPRNLGAIVRSAAAFGAYGVLIPERRSAGMTAAAWKTSAGAAAHIPIARATNFNRSLRDYADAGLILIGLDGNAAMGISEVPDVSGPVVLVVGSEGAGLSRLVRETCDYIAAIPIRKSVESLNAGVAAGIAL